MHIQIKAKDCNNEQFKRNDFKRKLTKKLYIKEIYLKKLLNHLKI